MAVDSTVREFAHPIEAVAGMPALLTHVLALQYREESETQLQDAFSRSTCAALRRAAAVPATETEDGRAVIDPGSYMRAELAIAAEHRNEKKAYTKPNEVVLEAIRNSAGPEDFEDRVRGLARPEPAQDTLSQVIVAPELTAMLAEAARIAREVSHGQRRVDARHALFACLKTLEGQQAIWTEGLPDPGEQTTFTIDRIRSALQGALEVSAKESASADETPDELGVWTSELSQLQADTSIRRPETERRSDTAYVRDEPARTLADDRLGIATEARALAEVICLRDPGPPLAVGLFGDWGSGKSSYMNLVEAAIDELVDRNRSAPSPNGLFVDGVVHIRFNAWHYNDADLWASLTSEFFRQLRIGGHAGTAGAVYADLVNKVAERVAKAEKDAQVNEDALAAKRSKAAEAQKRIDELNRTAGRRRAQVLAKTLSAVLADEGEDTARALESLGVDAATIDDDKKREALSLEIERTTAFPGRVASVLRGLAAAFAGRSGKLSKTAYGIAFATILVIAVWIGLRAAFPTRFGDGIAAFLGGLTVLGGLGAAALKAYSAIEPLFRVADRFVRDLRKDEEDTAREISEKQKKLAEIEESIAQLEEEKRQSVADAARFQGASPQQVLDFFLHETETTRSFDSALGTVSRVRRAFEQLDAIFREGDASAAGKFERIVLYIDDLDRCRAQQVVRVLEAVHLLLAFPLFVVVVGVDARWLEKSLLEFYDKTLDKAGEKGAGGVRSNGGEATVYDFLEKIFQVPIRLKRLSSMPGDAYSGYVRHAAGPVAHDGGGGGGDEDRGDDETEGRTEIEPVDVEIRPVPETVAAGEQEVKLGRGEVAMFEKLGPIAGKTPRAVKRFINLYRFVRGTRRGSELDDFLGSGDENDATVKPFAAYQFWLAVDSGMQPEQTHALREAVAHMAVAGNSCEALTAPVLVNPEPNRPFDVVDSEGWAGPTRPDGWDRLHEFWSSVPDAARREIHAAFQQVIQVLPGEEGLETLKTAMKDTRRFSAAADWGD